LHPSLLGQAQHDGKVHQRIALGVAHRQRRFADGRWQIVD